jgi:ParB/RepB/Spo0J family partition protein
MKVEYDPDARKKYGKPDFYLEMKPNKQTGGSMKATMVDIKRIVPSKTNPRKNFDDASMKELIESIKEKGIIYPITCRAIDDEKQQCEIVDGERRYRAAKAAGLKEVPVDIRVMDDDEAAEAQMISFVKQDITPMEEAEMYDRLAQKGNDVKAIAKKTGRTPSRVAQTMVLLNLIKDWQKVYREDHINRTQAMSVARLTEEQQKDLYDEVHYTLGRGQPDTRLFQEIITRMFHLALDNAVFDKSDETLIPNAGPCTLCPKCSENDLNLFLDFGKEAICTDNRCFKQKMKAFHVRSYSQLRKSKEPFVLITEDEYTRKSDVLNKSEWKAAPATDKAAVKAMIWNGIAAGKIITVKPKRIPKQGEKPAEKKQKPKQKEESYEERQAKEKIARAAGELRFIEILKALIPKLPEMKDTKELAKFVVVQTHAEIKLLLRSLGEKEVNDDEKQYKLLSKHLSDMQIVYFGVIAYDAQCDWHGQISNELFQLCKKRNVNYKAILKRISDEEKAAKKAIDKALKEKPAKVKIGKAFNEAVTKAVKADIKKSNKKAKNSKK